MLKHSAKASSQLSYENPADYLRSVQRQQGHRYFAKADITRQISDISSITFYCRLLNQAHFPLSQIVSKVRCFTYPNISILCEINNFLFGKKYTCSNRMSSILVILVYVRQRYLRLSYVSFMRQFYFNLLCHNTSRNRQKIAN